MIYFTFSIAFHEASIVNQNRIDTMKKKTIKKAVYFEK